MRYLVAWYFHHEGHEKHGSTGEEPVKAIGIEHAEQVAQVAAARKLLRKVEHKESFQIVSVASLPGD